MFSFRKVSDLWWTNVHCLFFPNFKKALRNASIWAEGAEIASHWPKQGD